MSARDPMTDPTAHWNRGGGWLGVRLVSLCLVATWMAGCQGPASTGKPPADGEQVTPVKPAAVKASGRASQIAVENDVCDLGEIGVSSKHTGQFKFTNTGSAPLKIELVRSCCGVAIKGVEAGQEYAPGHSGALEFECQALALPTPGYSRLLYLQTNDPQRNIVTLTIKANIVRRVEYKPERLKLLLKSENAGCPEITLSSVDGRPFSITDFKATGNTITAQFDPDAKATKFVLTPKVDMEKLERNMRGQISINLTHPECDNVMLAYDTLAEFELSTPTIMMFGLRAGRALQREIWILSNYQDDFEIESVSSPKGTTKLLEKTKVDNRYRLRIEITPPVRKPDDIVVSDTLQVKIKNGPTLSVPIRGYYQEK